MLHTLIHCFLTLLLKFEDHLLFIQNIVIKLLTNYYVSHSADNYYLLLGFIIVDLGMSFTFGLQALQNHTDRVCFKHGSKLVL